MNCPSGQSASQEHGDDDDAGEDDDGAGWCLYHVFDSVVEHGDDQDHDDNDGGYDDISGGDDTMAGGVMLTVVQPTKSSSSKRQGLARFDSVNL